MKYISEFRDKRVASALAAALATEVDPSRHYSLMEFCGGHTHAIFRYGVQDLLPPNVHLVHGPGCPVCVCPEEDVFHAIQRALREPVTLAAVPGLHI